MLSSPEVGVPVLRTRQARIRSIVFPIIIACAVAALILLLTTFSGRPGLTGGGSTLAQPLLQQAAAAFRESVAADDPNNPQNTALDWVVEGSGIDYEPVGSMGGILRLQEGQTDFAVSDYPLSEQSLNEFGLAQFPIAIGAVAVVHNLDLPGATPLRLDAASLARIYLGQITRWNDPALTAQNPGVALPDLAITPVHRSDGSGSTFGFTAYLAAEQGWAQGPGQGPLITWPTGPGAERSGGLLQTVAATAGALGYADPGQAAAAGLSVAALKNTAGGYTQPGADTMRAAIEGEQWSSAAQFAAPLTSSSSPQAYPVTVAIYAMVSRAQDKVTDRRRVLGFLTYLIEDYDTGTQALGYLPLPANAAKAVRDYWASSLDHR